jgi:hypothetical protein
MNLEKLLKDAYMSGVTEAQIAEQVPNMHFDFDGMANAYAKQQVKNNVVLPDVRKRYKFTFGDVETETLIIIHEDTERKAYKAAFRTFETPKDRELRLISKELNAF